MTIIINGTEFTGNTLEQAIESYYDSIDILKYAPFHNWTDNDLRGKLFIELSSKTLTQAELLINQVDTDSLIWMHYYISTFIPGNSAGLNLLDTILTERHYNQLDNQPNV